MMIFVHFDNGSSNLVKGVFKGGGFRVQVQLPLNIFLGLIFFRVGLRYFPGG